MRKEYEKVIGLEVHIELATKTKIFCGCSTAFGAKPNVHTCPVCTGMPGSLPVLNRQVVEYAMAVGLATNCRIRPITRFDRKNYFYPDNPQNYQISQLYLPICYDGWLEIETEEGKKKIRIHEIHMEEDAGKLIHEEGQSSTLIDYNRSGVPLIEIVTEPDFGDAKEVIAYLEKLRLLVQYLGASDGKLQEGSMRVDVNLSVREKGRDSLGTRTEMKNLNSFKAISRAIEGEAMRQIGILEEGGEVIQETRRWDDTKETSFSMRSKEDAKDYRYFPEPDLLSVSIDKEWIERIAAARPEMREDKLERYQKEYGLPYYDADLLTSDRSWAELFEKTTVLCGQPKKVSNWIMGEAMRLLKEKGNGKEKIPFSPENLAKLILMVEEGRINGTVAKKIFEVIFSEDVDPEIYAKEKGLEIITDLTAIQKTIKEVLAANPQSIEDYQAGKKKAMGYLVGQTMRQMAGKADPRMVNRLVEEALRGVTGKEEC